MSAEWIIVAVILLLIVGLLGAIFLIPSGPAIEVTVVDRAYAPGRVGTGIGTTNTDGQLGTTVITTYDSEDYILIVKEGEEVYSVTVTAAAWAKAKPGDKVKVRHHWTGPYVAGGL